MAFKITIFSCCLVLYTLLNTQSAHADIALSDNCTIHFASKKQARKLLGQKDDYTQRLSKFDLIAKKQSDSPVTTKKFLSFARKQGMKWSEEEQQRLEAIFNSVRLSMAPYAKFLPKQVNIVKTTGRVESGAFYTRGDSIFIPARNMARDDDQLTTVMLHELFHILSRNNAELRDALYAAIGFKKTSELVLPESLRDRKISNPDVPILTHLIKVFVAGEQRWATPFIYSEVDYDRSVMRVFFQYLKLGMLVYDWDGESAPKAALKDGKYILLPIESVGGLYEQIGRNTDYLFHAEEVLADNFALLVQGHNVASPEVLARMKSAFDKAY